MGHARHVALKTSRRTGPLLGAVGFAVAWFAIYLALSRDLGQSLVGAVAGGVIFGFLGVLLARREDG